MSMRAYPLKCHHPIARNYYVPSILIAAQDLLRTCVNRPWKVCYKLHREIVTCRRCYRCFHWSSRKAPAQLESRMHNFFSLFIIVNEMSQQNVKFLQTWPNIESAS